MGRPESPAIARGRIAVEKFLKHYGTKGMRWGVRKASGSDNGPTHVETHIRPGRRVKTSGGKGHSPHEDAVAAAVARQKAKKSTTDSLSNHELQAAVRRMQLEQQYSQLSSQRNVSIGAKGHKFVKSLLGLGKTANEVKAFENSPAGQQIKDKLKNPESE